ncbi:MAG: serine hydrolase [Pseudomonadota bacterium]
MKHFAFIFLLMTASWGVAGNDLVWPEGTWQRPADPARVLDPEALAALEAFAFPTDPESSLKTDGLVIVKDGELVYERYDGDYTPEMRHYAWSVSKSVTNALFGAAQYQGLLDIDEPVARYNDTLIDGDRNTTTFRDLLAMSSGVDFNESYEYGPFLSSVIAMLYTMGREDMGEFAADHPRLANPGSVWRYKSGDSLILMRALRDVVGRDRYKDLPWELLFEPLGIESAVWERDEEGIFVGSSYLHLTPRDLARFGLLFARDGVWQDQRILPEGWVLESAQLNPAFIATYDDAPDWLRNRARYGLHWWSNAGDEAAGIPPAYPDLPQDMLIGSGHWGQKLFVFPSQDLVIVRTADDRGWGFDTGEFLRLALAAVTPEASS